MTVLENVLVGAHALGRAVGETEALEALDYVGLADRAGQPAAALPVRHAEARRDRPRARRASRACSCSTSPPAGSTTRRSRSSATSSCGSATTTS